MKNSIIHFLAVLALAATVGCATRSWAAEPTPPAAKAPDKPLTLALTRARGKRTPFTVQPLREAPARDWAAESDAITDVDALRALHAAAKHAGAPAATLDAIVARGKALAAPAATHDEESTA